MSKISQFFKYLKKNKVKMSNNKPNTLEIKKFEVIKKFEEHAEYSFDNLNNNIHGDIKNNHIDHISDRIKNFKFSFKNAAFTMLITPLEEYIDDDAKYKFSSLMTEFENFFNSELYKFKTKIADYIDDLDDQPDNRLEDWDFECMMFRDSIRDYIKQKLKVEND